MLLSTETTSPSGRRASRWLHAAALACGLIVAVLSPRIALADIPVQVEMSTGSDDLRGGNRAFFSAILMDGTETSEKILSTGLGSGSSVSAVVNLPDEASRDNIRGFIIRHDGNPRSGHPFDTYDNWDLRHLVVTHSGVVLYDSRNDPEAIDFVHRFTGQSRKIKKIVRAAEGEPDFVISAIRLVPRGVQVVVRNNGASGRTSHVACSVAGRFATRSARVLVASRGSVSLTVGALGRPSATTTCVIEGTDLDGNPEQVTANNALRARL